MKNWTDAIRGGYLSREDVAEQRDYFRMRLLLATDDEGHEGINATLKVLDDIDHALDLDWRYKLGGHNEPD
jgi:hypothetical protein